MKSEAQFEEIKCKKCGSTRWYQAKVSKYYWRIYCKDCNKWNKVASSFHYPKRIDKQNMPSHCGKCKYFSETVFEGETANGWGSWEGDCLCDEAPIQKTKSRYYGCEFGMLKTPRNNTQAQTSSESLNKDLTDFDKQNPKSALQTSLNPNIKRNLRKI